MYKLLLVSLLVTLTPLATAATFQYRVPAVGLGSSTLAGIQQTPAPASCVLPWGGSLAHDATIPAYSSSTVQEPASCSSAAITLSCTNGTLSNPSAAESCQTVDAYAANVVLELDFNNGFSNPQNKAILNSSGVTVQNGVATFTGSSTLRFPGSVDYAFPGDFTIEYRIKFADISTNWTSFTPANQYLMDIGGNGYYFGWRATTPTSVPNAWYMNAGGPTYSTVPVAGQWYDIAIARKNGVTGIFINNVLAQSVTTAATNWGSTLTLTIGNYGGGYNYGFLGEMDYMRITKGASRFNF